MSFAEEPNKIKTDIDNESVQDALKIMQDNRLEQTQYKQDIIKIRDLDTSTFSVDTPVGNNRVSQALLRQVTEMLMRRLQRPSFTLRSETVEPEVERAVRDGVMYIMERGGWKDVLKGKPSAFRENLLYGNGIIRIGSEEESQFPIKFSSVVPGSLFTDSNATVMRTESGARAVTRAVVVYTYDYSQAVQMYPNIKFGKGEIPNKHITEVKDFDKTWNQEIDSDFNKVEIAHFFDIGGDKPRYTVFAGSRATVLEEFKGEDYPFVMEEKPYIPLIMFRQFDANEGLFDYGFGHAFYKYALNRNAIFNKLITGTFNNLSPTRVLNAPKDSEGEMIAKLQNSLELEKAGYSRIIINDTGAPMSVTPLEADFVQTSLQQVNEAFMAEMAMWGINLRTANLPASTTATAILEIQSIDDEVVLEMINKNTDSFKFAVEATMQFIAETIDPDSTNPIPTSVKMPKLTTSPDGTVELATDKLGQEILEPMTGFTDGELAQIISNNDFLVEVSTRSGVMEKDIIKMARWQLAAQIGGNNPAVSQQAIEGMAGANNLSLDLGEAQQKLPAQGVRATGQALKEEQDIQQPR